MLQQSLLSYRPPAGLLSVGLAEQAQHHFRCEPCRAYGDCRLPRQLHATRFCTWTSCHRSRSVDVVLLDQMDNLGYKGQLVQVKPGYARNFLIPEGRATYATPANLKLHRVILSVCTACSASHEHCLATASLLGYPAGS